MAIGGYAMIRDGETYVENTVLMEDGFTMEGFYFISMKDKFAQPGMWYNPDDGLFYFDSEYTVTESPYPPPDKMELPDLDEQ